EQRTAVLAEDDPEEVAEDRLRFPRPQGACHDRLRHLIGDDDRRGEGQKGGPARPAGHAPSAGTRRRSPIATGPLDSSIEPRVTAGSNGTGAHSTESASVSSATAATCSATASGRPSTQRSIRSSRASPASLRRSWTARWSS